MWNTNWRCHFSTFFLCSLTLSPVCAINTRRDLKNFTLSVYHVKYFRLCTFSRRKWYATDTLRKRMEKKHVEMFAEWQAGFTSYVYPLQHNHNSVNIQMNGIVKETSNKWRSNSRAYHQSGYKTRHNGTKDRLSFLCFGHVKAVVRQRRIWKYLHCTLVQPMYTTYDL